MVVVAVPARLGGFPGAQYSTYTTFPSTRQVTWNGTPAVILVRPVVDTVATAPESILTSSRLDADPLSLTRPIRHVWAATRFTTAPAYRVPVSPTGTARTVVCMSPGATPVAVWIPRMLCAAVVTVSAPVACVR